MDANGNPNIPASLTKPTSTATELESRDRTPYNQTWQIGVQRQFRGNWLAEVDYVGTRGVKLPILLPDNQLPANLWGVSTTPQLLRPFPQYLDITHFANDANSFYHSLQASVVRRWSSGVLSFAYTCSKVIDYQDSGTAGITGLQNIYNLQAERGIANYDVPHRLVANYVYRIPLGRGSKLLNGVPVVQDVVRGWEFSGRDGISSRLAFAGAFRIMAAVRLHGHSAPRTRDCASCTRSWRPPYACDVVQHQRLHRGPGGIHFKHRAALLYGPGINNWDTWR